MATWINEAQWPVAWSPNNNTTGIWFSPIIKQGSYRIVYCIGYNVLVLYKYNISLNTWTSLGATPVQLYMAPAISPDETKLVGHGVQGNVLYIYDIINDTWTASTAAPALSGTGETAQIQVMVWTDNDTIWCHIRDASGNQRNKCYKYVISTDTWTQYTNVFSKGPYNMSRGMAANTTKTALFVGNVYAGSDRCQGFKYVIATDTYSAIAHSPTWGDFNVYASNDEKLWFINSLTSYTGYYYFDCDSEVFGSSPIFPDDMPTRNHSSQWLPIGVYGLDQIIAYHYITAEVHNRSYSLVAVETELVENIAYETAIGRGNITSNPLGDITAYGVCWSVSANPTIADSHTDGGATEYTGHFYHSMTGLSSGTHYHVRAYATNPDGTVYGADLEFDTLIEGAPQVTTQSVTNIQATEATGNGTIISIGDSAVTQHGVCWSTLANPTISDSHTTDGVADVGTFVSHLESLAAETEYYVRAYATNTQGTSYGNNVQFTTIAAPAAKKPIVQVGLGGTIYSPSWTELAWTGDLLRFNIKRGRMHDLDKVETGTAIIELLNTRGDYWRYNTASPYYPYLKPGILVALSMDYDEVTYPLYYGLVEALRPGWIGAAEGGLIPIMTLTCADLFKNLSKLKLHGLTGKIGDFDNIAAMKTNSDSGQAYIEIKSLGDDPDSGSDIYDLHIGQTIKIGDDDNSETNKIVAIDTGAYILEMENNLAHNYTVGHNGYIKKFPAVLSGIRITDICCEFGWPLALTTIADGKITIAELIPPTEGYSGLEHLLEVAEAEGGNAFMALDGKLVFQDKDYRLDSESQATFSDDGVGLKYALPELEDDDALLYNEVRISGDAIGEQIYRDETYQSVQGPRPLSRANSVLAYDADAFDQAYTIVERYKNSIMRGRNLLIYPDADPTNLYPITLGYELSTKITLQLGQAPNLAYIDREYHIEAIEHNATPDGAWETKWQLWDVNLFRIFQAEHTGYLHKENLTPDTYADCHDASEADDKYNDNTIIAIGQANDGGVGANDFRIFRGFLQFDTSTISTGNIASVELILEITEYFQIDNEFDLTLVGAGSVTSPLDESDYNTLMGQTTSYGTVTMSPSAVNKKVIIIALNSTGIAAINKTGKTYFGLRSSRDISEISPGEQAYKQEYITIAGSNSSLIPRLAVKLHEVT